MGALMGGGMGAMSIPGMAGMPGMGGPSATGSVGGLGASGVGGELMMDQSPMAGFSTGAGGTDAALSAALPGSSSMPGQRNKSLIIDKLLTLALMNLI